jgi:hypothetical protein
LSYTIIFFLKKEGVDGHGDGRHLHVETGQYRSSKKKKRSIPIVKEEKTINTSLGAGAAAYRFPPSRQECSRRSGEEGDLARTRNRGGGGGGGAGTSPSSSLSSLTRHSLALLLLPLSYPSPVVALTLATGWGTAIAGDEMGNGDGRRPGCSFS